MSIIYCKPSYFSSTLNVAILVGKDLVYFILAILQKIGKNFAFTYIHTHTCVQVNFAHQLCN